MSRMVRGMALGGATALVVLVASRAVLGPARADDEHGPLAPLAGLVGGRWVDTGEGDGEAAGAGSVVCELRWGDEGRSICERVVVAGEVVAERRYFWHPGKLENGSLVVTGIRSDGEVREGILREDEPGSIEMRFDGHSPDGSGRSYRERIRFLDRDRIVRSLRQVTEDQEVLKEVLIEERTLVRER